MKARHAAASRSVNRSVPTTPRVYRVELTRHLDSVCSEVTRQPAEGELQMFSAQALSPDFMLVTTSDALLGRRVTDLTR